MGGRMTKWVAGTKMRGGGKNGQQKLLEVMEGSGAEIG